MKNITNLSSAENAQRVVKVEFLKSKFCFILLQSGTDNGTIKIPVASNYGKYTRISNSDTF